jgi:ATP-dependent DNA helicase RecG
MIRKTSVADLIRELNGTDESEDLEAKQTGASDVGKTVYETICALSNEPDLGGGTILLGVDKEESLFPFYAATGVQDPDKLSSDIASACATMFNQPVRVDITPSKIGDAVILRVDVPELPSSQKPVYFKGAGLPRGAFRRIGPTDIRCTDEDIQTFYQGKAKDPYDARIVRDARWEDIDPVAISAYRKARAEANSQAEELNWSDEDMLHSLGAIQRLDGRVQVTITGLLTFGKSASLRRFFPTHRVDYIRVPGKVWVQNPDAGFEALDMRGPIVTIIGRLLAAITDDMPKTFVIEDSLSGQRTETSVVPIRVIREAVVNALMHRSYDVFQPIQIVRYANRIVIKNPGYSLKSQDRFEEPGSAIRNPTIAEILHETRFAETKGSGIRVMQEKMKQSGLAAPTFESDRQGAEFTATFLFHHFLDESDWSWLSKFSDLSLSEDQMRALIFVREIGAIDNSAYRSLTQLDTLSASKSLKTLVQSDLLKLQGSGAKTHYVAGSEMLAREVSASSAKPSLLTSERSIYAKGNSSARSPLAELPVPLRIAVRTTHLKGRLKPDEVREIILKLCDWKPLSINEISDYLSKQANYLGTKFVAPMVAEGLLCYLYPEMPQHPGQKYQTVRLSEVGGRP